MRSCPFCREVVTYSVSENEIHLYGGEVVGMEIVWDGSELSGWVRGCSDMRIEKNIPVRSVLVSAGETLFPTMEDAILSLHDPPTKLKFDPPFESKY